MDKFIPLCVPEIKGNEVEYVTECIKSGWVSSTGGKYLDRFEEEFSKYTGISHSNAVINGTAALHLALKALDIGEGDEVIIPSLTFISTANAVRYVGADVVFVDVKLEDYTMDPAEVEKAITKKTKAIIPVHLYGNVCDMNEIMRIAHENNLYVIEDATEALGSFWSGKMAGSFGHIGCYSFNGNKLITTGAGGMICTGDVKLNKRIDYLKNQTKRVLDNRSIIHDEVGFNYRMPNLLAAFGLAQLENIREYVGKKKEIFNCYKTILGDNDDIEFSESSANEVCPWLTSVRILGEGARDEVIRIMDGRGIACRPFFSPLHKMEPYKNSKVIGDMENTEKLSREGLNLPSSVGLDNEGIVRICKEINMI